MSKIKLRHLTDEEKQEEQKEIEGMNNAFVKNNFCPLIKEQCKGKPCLFFGSASFSWDFTDGTRDIERMPFCNLRRLMENMVYLTNKKCDE